MGNKRGRIAAAAAAAAAIAAFAYVGAAQGAGYSLRPDGDVSGQWNTVGASSAWDALNDSVTQPTAPGSGDYISSGGSSRVTEVSLSSQTLNNEAITAGKAWVYAGAGILSSAKVEVIWGGSVRGSLTISGGLLGSSAQWRSISVVPPDQAALNDLRLRFTSTAGADVSVRAAYFELTTQPTSSCPLATPGSAIGMTVSGCTTIASDTASNPDPAFFWEWIECQTPTRHQQITSGGDPHATGSGAGQGNNSFRRLTVYDGDDYAGERCELGHNNMYSPTAFYREGQRRVTFMSIRMPTSSPIADPRWRDVMQMKQAQPYNNSNPASIFEMQVRESRWWVGSNWTGVWDTPAQQNVWTRFAFDVFYSSDPAKGSIKIYVDLNGDGDASDANEQSPRVVKATLAAESSPAHPDGVSAGESIPSALRAGIYQHQDYSCPNGCSVDIDNVQVLGP